MADKKISALTSATTPLAGTEVLPIVQSGTTVKVPVDNLTVQNIRANATSGILQITGPAAASTRIVTVPDANFTAARTDAGQSFTGNQAFISSGEAMTLGANATASNFAFYIRNTSAAHAIALTSAAGQYLDNAAAGDLIVGAPTGKFQRFGNLSTGADRGWFNDNGLAFPSGKGIDFSATAGTGTSELLADYEEGTFTPTLTCTSGTITLNSGQDLLQYTKIGRMVYISGQIVISAISSPSGLITLNGLPFTIASLAELSSRGAATVFGGPLAITVNTVVGYYLGGTTEMYIEKYVAGDVARLAGDLTSSTSFFISMQYVAA